MTIPTSDPWYQAETIPPNLRLLGERLRTHFGVPAVNIGIKGSLTHQRGYHRSRAFLLNSPYALDRSYSVSAPGNRNGDPNWCCGLDVTLPASQLLPFCRRLDTAVRAGRLEKVAEWYGNTDGDQRVDGFDNIENTVASSDSSHLWHAHLSFIREYANDDHTDLYNVLTGQEDPVTPEEIEKIAQRTATVILGAQVPFIPELTGGQKTGPVGASIGYTLSRVVHLVAEAGADRTRDETFQATLDRIMEVAGGDIDAVAIGLIIREEADRTRAAIVDAARADLAGLAEALHAGTAPPAE